MSPLNYCNNNEKTHKNEKGRKKKKHTHKIYTRKKFEAEECERRNDRLVYSHIFWFWVE